VVTASDDNTAKIWDAESGKELATLSGHSDGVMSASFSPDGRRVVTASDDNTAKIWDAESGKELATLSGHSDVVMSASFSPDGRRVVTASFDNTAKIWDAVPWRMHDLPGDATMDLDKRLELWNRQRILASKEVTK
jgi:WD40 repeat protein